MQDCDLLTLSHLRLGLLHQPRWGYANAWNLILHSNLLQPVLIRLANYRSCDVLGPSK